MKYLVTGTNGQVGSSIIELVEDSIGLDRDDADLEIDITNEEVVRDIVRCEPDVIVHAAAFVDVDAAENNSKEAKRVNVQGTSNIVSAAEKTEAHLIFISTDNVFDGERGNYSEKDKLNPVNFYGETKTSAEKMVEDSDSDSTIFRTALVFKEGYQNFFTWLMGKIEKGDEIGVVTDQKCNPTYAPNLAEAIIESAERNITGVYNMAGASAVTRYESAQIMKEELGLEGQIERAKRSDIPWEADRPKDSSLDLSKFNEKFETDPLSLSESLEIAFSD